MTDERLGLPSASSFASDVACPGRRQLLASLPSSSESNDADAARGTRIHKALQTENTSELSEDELEDYNAGLKHIEQIVGQWLADKNLPGCHEMKRELRLWMNHPETFEPLCSGQLDRHWLSQPHLLIVDLKSGWSTHVPPSNQSWQLRLQALLADKEYEHLETIRVAFCKPKLKAAPTDWCDYSRQDLIQTEQAVLFHLWETQQLDAPRRPGIHCRYCAAKAYCREAAAYSLLPSVIDGEGQLTIEQRVALMSPADHARMFDASPIIKKILEANLAWLKAQSDEALAAMGLGRGKAKRLDPIVDTKGAFDRLKAEGLHDEQLWSLLSLGKTELIKELQRQFGWSTDAARAWVKGQLSDYIERKESEQPLIRL